MRYRRISVDNLLITFALKNLVAGQKFEAIAINFPEKNLTLAIYVLYLAYKKGDETMNELENAKAKFEAEKNYEYAGICDALITHIEKWRNNDFVCSLVDQIIDEGHLSPKQNDWLTVFICEFEGDIMEAKRLRAQLTHSR